MYFKRVLFILFFLLGCSHNSPLLLPTVVITFPSDGAYIRDTVIIKAEAVDNVEIAKI